MTGGEARGMVARIVESPVKAEVKTTTGTERDTGVMQGKSTSCCAHERAVRTAGEATVVRVIEKPDGTKVTIMSNKDTIIEKPGELKMTRKADGRVIMEDAAGRITEHRPKHTIPIAERPLNVASGAHEPIGQALSNFSRRPFTMDGKFYASVEAFYQGLKWPDAAKRAEIASLSGKDAKAAGRGAPHAETFIYEGKERKFGSPEHHALVKRAIGASLEQNPQVMNEFLDTYPRPIEHKTGRPESRNSKFPGSKFTSILLELRQELLAQRIENA